MGITATCTVIEFVDGIKGWDTLPLQRGELGNFMSQSITASLQEEAEEGVASSVDELLLYLSTIDKCLIPKEEYSQLCHLGGVLEGCGGEGLRWRVQGMRFSWKEGMYNILNIGAFASAISDS